MIVAAAGTCVALVAFAAAVLHHAGSVSPSVATDPASIEARWADTDGVVVRRKRELDQVSSRR